MMGDGKPADFRQYRRRLGGKSSPSPCRERGEPLSQFGIGLALRSDGGPQVGFTDQQEAGDIFEALEQSLLSWRKYYFKSVKKALRSPAMIGNLHLQITKLSPPATPTRGSDDTKV